MQRLECHVGPFGSGHVLFRRLKTHVRQAAVTFGDRAVNLVVTCAKRSGAWPCGEGLVLTRHTLLIVARHPRLVAANGVQQQVEQRQVPA